MAAIANFFKSIFSKEEINNKRQIEADMAKAICVIGMIFVHVFENFTFNETGSGTDVLILLRIGNTIFGASLFMFCMGLGICYSKNNTPNKLMLRGAILFGAGLLLNFFRAGLILIIGKIIDPSWVETKDIIYQIFQVDILFFAGLSLVLFGLLRKIKIPTWVILLISIAMSVLGTIFNGYDFGDAFLNCLVGLFVGTIGDSIYNVPSCFPLLNWFLIVVSGYCFAYILKRVIKKERFYLIFSGISLLAIGLYIGFCIGPKAGYFQEDFICTFHIAIYDALISICGAVFALGLLYFLSKILPKFVLTGAHKLATYITIIYFIQWLIIANVTVLIEAYYPDAVFEKYQLILISIGILSICVLLALLIKTVIPKRLKRKKEIVENNDLNRN